MPKYYAVGLKRVCSTGRNELAKHSVPVRINAYLDVDGSPYNLKSLVYHKGATFRSGHYVYAEKCADGWMVHNDCRVNFVY